MSIPTCKKGFGTDIGVVDLNEHDPFSEDLTGLGAPMPLEGQVPAAANAAVALTQLHGWDSDFVSVPDGTNIKIQQCL